MKLIHQISNATYDVKWLVDGFKKEIITVNNDYQRRFVWTDKDQINLIETILLGYSIPEIYIHKKSTNPESGDTTYEIVDGQQRITSLFRYINGEFALNKSDMAIKFKNKAFKDLDNEDKGAVWKYPFSVRVIEEEVTEEDIRQLFLRLNATDKSLNPQELRNASFTGEFLTLAENIAEEDFWNSIYPNKESIRRMQDIQFVSEILIYFRNGIISNSQENINRAYDTYNLHYDEALDDKRRFLEIIELLNDIISDSSELLSIMKRSVHLYSIIVVADYALDDEKTLIQFKKRIIKFFKEYLDEKNPSTNKLIQDYRENSQEGTGSKVRRMNRYKALKTYIIED